MHKMFPTYKQCGRMAQPLPHTTSNTHSYYHSFSLLLACISCLFVLIPTHWSFTQNKSFPRTGHSHVLVIHLEQFIPTASPSYITYLYLSMHWACSGGFSIYTRTSLIRSSKLRTPLSTGHKLK